jgi:hypothetical protein
LSTPFSKKSYRIPEEREIEMKRCPACQQTYEDDQLSFCLNDGTLLEGAPSSFNPQETLRISAPQSTAPTLPQETWRAGGSTYTPPVTPASGRNWLPWILGGALLLIVGFIGVGIVSAVIYYKWKASGADSDARTYNSNASRSNTNSKNSNSGARKSGSASSSTPKDSLANTSARSVTDLATEQVGDFKLSGVKSPQGHIFKNEDATELMMATYDRTDDSNYVLLYLASFSSPAKAQDALKDIVDWSVKQGARIERQETNTGRNGEQLGTRYLLLNSDGSEDVYWSNGRYAFNAYNGKKETGVLSVFEKAYPY